MRMEATKQREIDEAMIKLDGRTDKSRLKDHGKRGIE